MSEFLPYKMAKAALICQQINTNEQTYLLQFLHMICLTHANMTH